MREGWGMKELYGYTMADMEKGSSRLEKSFQDKILERVFSMPRVHRVSQGAFTFVRKGTM